jgi:RimJ/RimL family protein N-acetyltransferase
MTHDIVFRTLRLSGRPPEPGAEPLYVALFGPQAGSQLESDVQDWTLREVAPWTLSHAGHDVGVGGFRIGFGDAGLELSFHFLPEVWGQGLASEFVQGALDHAGLVLREDRFFARVEPDNAPSIRVLSKAGFTVDPSDTEHVLMRLNLSTTHPD